ncbi:MAG: hypothetical protein A2Y56_02995 [Candidatus Aminicenantes bacterium RBG_13_63_10]|nr:MAG: hypothetical protein A2Y56_02995 [Candidatus Aminicenantes bacterium RBG_13_63_10]
MQWVRDMLKAIGDLPLRTRKDFLRDRHHAAAAESYLRRALEALFDMGRHILSKKFASPATEYKEIAQGLLERKVLSEKEADLLRDMAGYRNRMVHFYHDIGPQELYEICRNHLDDVRAVLKGFVRWIRKNR